MDVAIGKAVRLSNADPLGQVLRPLGFLVVSGYNLGSLNDVRRQCSRLDLLVECLPPDR
jgi:hypothetical protein